MSRREEARERLQRLLQTAVFFAVVVVLGVVLYAAVVVQQQRRENEQRTATPSATPLETLPTGPLEAGFLLAYPDRTGVLDPALVTGDSTLVRSLFFGLTTWQRGGQKVGPLLATSWDVSADGLVYTFHLRRDFYWVQCDWEARKARPVRLVVASDVVFGIARALRPETGAPNAQVLYPIQGAWGRHHGNDAAVLGVEAVDDHTVRFTLTMPTVNFPDRLADPVAWPVPPEPIQAYGDAWTEPRKIWVNGSLCPVDWRPGQQITVVPNEALPGDLVSTYDVVTVFGPYTATRSFPRPAYPPLEEIFPVPTTPTGTGQYPDAVGPLDPVRIPQDSPIPQTFFLGLTGWSSGSGVVPVLAEDWRGSEDGRTYTFSLRRDVYWVRCDPESGQVTRVRAITAGDVVFAIERALDPETQAFAAPSLYPIRGAWERHSGDKTAALGVEAVDDRTVRFTLTMPTMNFPARLALPVAWPVPPEPIQDHGEAWTEPGKVWVSGHFCPIVWIPGQEFEMVPNPELPEEIQALLVMTEYRSPAFPPTPLPSPAYLPPY